ncbi:MAG: cell division/cell wall cluster transcriptional repressor MraZ [Spirochaetales bacterium]|nr:cell division/cell wall cluster transcriptional repressor MraZ [Spirochaetales bacterium]
MITGEFKVSLDEKGRIILPTKVRAHFDDLSLVLTQGVDTCLWIFSPDEWDRVTRDLMESTSRFQARTRLLHRRIIAPAQETEMDKTGRITISQTLREYAALRKECVILGIANYLEIWEESRYREYWLEHENEFQDAAEELGKVLSV